jgi:hypothetical protein
MARITFSAALKREDTMKRFSIVLVVTFLLGLAAPVFAHSGGLDQDGGHYNHETGQYHYHRR